MCSVGRLNKFNIAFNVLRWIHDFISNREQYVCIKGRKSYPSIVTSIVPQGTFGGPKYFNINISDMQVSNNDNECTSSSSSLKITTGGKVQRLKFAKDTSCSAVINCNSEELMLEYHERMQGHLNEL